MLLKDIREVTTITGVTTRKMNHNVALDYHRFYSKMSLIAIDTILTGKIPPGTEHIFYSGMTEAWELREMFANLDGPW